MHRGVRYRADRNIWRADVRMNGRRVCIGHFASEDDAVAAYEQFVIDNPEALVPKTRTDSRYKKLIGKLLDLIERNKGEECIVWDRRVNWNGYGVVGHSLAHRLAYSLCVGEIPDGIQVLHRCDNRPCINPDHLFLGTHLDNIADKVAKGRQTKGEDVAGRKLTEGDVRSIRETHSKCEKSQKDIAAEFGVSQMTISEIVRRKKWKHI